MNCVNGTGINIKNSIIYPYQDDNPLTSWRFAIQSNRMDRKIKLPVADPEQASKPILIRFTSNIEPQRLYFFILNAFSECG